VFGVSLKAYTLVGGKLPYGRKQSEGTFLYKILAITACKEQWSGASTHQMHVSLRQNFLCIFVTSSKELLKFNVA
jgi:hypothetical protein